MSAIESAIEHAARAIAEHEGNERVFSEEDASAVARRGADAYRETARIAVSSFVVAIRDVGAPA